ncbi:E3 ubiquitin-protein ligase ARK2C-like [Mytilus edulis]|uniref:E3 ubiquitin-protein ligase ARK2C-like n=1 Tax=Mytilus edulis TaxID=6550 RepID=UPI0039EFBE89
MAFRMFHVDDDFEKRVLQNEIAASAYEAAQRPLTESVRRNPDAALALRLQKREVQTPLPPDIDEDHSAVIALQLQEQEHLEQELHDREVAQRLAGGDGNGWQRQNEDGRVPQLNEALHSMHGLRPSNQMNFGRSVRGPSMMGTLPSSPGLHVFGPGTLIDSSSDETEIDGEPSILPQPRPRLQHHRRGSDENPFQRNIRTDENNQRTDVEPSILPQPRPRLLYNRRGPDPNRFQRADENGHRPDIQPLPGMFRLRGNRDNVPDFNQEQRHDIVQPPIQRNPHNLLPSGGLRARLMDFGGYHRNPIQNRDNMSRFTSDDIDVDDYEALWELQERNGDVRSKGLTGEQIGRIPCHKFKSTPGLNKTFKSDKNSCSICLNEYKDGESIKTLPCFHSYHKTCIDKWLKSQAVCPVCRGNIKTN